MSWVYQQKSPLTTLYRYRNNHKGKPLMDPYGKKDLALLKRSQQHGDFIPHLPAEAHGSMEHEAAETHHEHASDGGTADRMARGAGC